jgi:hypothetical protein
MHYFLEKILDRPAGSESIDIYQALDMSMPGILGYRSICNGNTPIIVPDLRNKREREEYRGDNWCTNPAVAGDNLAPRSSFEIPDISDDVYDKVKEMWENFSRNS